MQNIAKNLIRKIFYIIQHFPLFIIFVPPNSIDRGRGSFYWKQGLRHTILYKMMRMGTLCHNNIIIFITCKSVKYAHS